MRSKRFEQRPSRPWVSAGFTRALFDPVDEPVAFPNFILKGIPYGYARTPNGFLISRCLDVFRAHEAVRAVQTIYSVNLHNPARPDET